EEVVVGADRLDSEDLGPDGGESTLGVRRGWSVWLWKVGPVPTHTGDGGRGWSRLWPRQSVCQVTSGDHHGRQRQTGELFEGGQRRGVTHGVPGERGADTSGELAESAGPCVPASR